MNFLQIVANHIIHLDRVTSTNSYALELIAKSEPTDGTVITASYQTHGKGQYGRKWFAEPGENILLSLILQPNRLNIDQIYFLNIIAALSVQYLIQQKTKEPVKIKWPNDIYINDQKVAGILIQNQINSTNIKQSVIGMGININQLQFDPNAPNPISLKMLNNIDYDINELLKELFQYLNVYYFKLKHQEYSNLKKEYLSHLYRFEQPSDFILDNGEKITGIIVDIADSGAAIIKSNNQEKSYMMHEIKMII